MQCPRCGVGSISDATHECNLCGYPRAPTAVADPPLTDEVHETLQAELADRFTFQVLLALETGRIRYLARDLERDRLVVLQLIPFQGPLDAELESRFHEGAALATALQHAHVVPVLDYGVARSVLWYTMEQVAGRTLNQVIKDAGRLDLEPTVRILEQIASGLEYVHRRGAVHGDLRPEHVVVAADGWVRITDPAVVNAIGRRSVPDGWSRNLWTTPYAAPEQMRGRPGGRTVDQYGLAVLAYECLAGRPPVRDSESGESPPRLHRVRPDVPSRVADAVHRAMRPDPAGRFPTVLDFLAVIGEGGHRSSTELLTPTDRPSGSAAQPQLLFEATPRRIPWKLAAVLAVVVVVGAASVWWANRSSTNGLQPWESSSLETGPVSQLDTISPLDTVPLPARPGQAPGAAGARPGPAVVAPPAPVQPGRLFINSTPWGRVYLDDSLIGNTPLTNLTVRSGAHQLRVVRDGFEPYERTITVAPGGVLRITDIVLTRGTP